MASVRSTAGLAISCRVSALEPRPPENSTTWSRRGSRGPASCAGGTGRLCHGQAELPWLCYSQRLNGAMRRRSNWVGLLLLVLSAACGSSGPPTAPSPIVTPPVDPGPSTPQPPTPPPPPTLGITKILAFGDSMTAGTTS